MDAVGAAVFAQSSHRRRTRAQTPAPTRPGPPEGYTQPVRSHQWIDERSLALHTAVAAKLEARPELLDVAKQNLRRWLSLRPAAALREWQAILDRAPLGEVIDLLRARSADAARLRQSSPFAGILSQNERQSILDVYESRRA